MTVEYHRIPKSFGGWIGGSITRCTAPAECRWCALKFPIAAEYTQPDGPQLGEIFTVDEFDYIGRE